MAGGIYGGPCVDCGGGCLCGISQEDMADICDCGIAAYGVHANIAACNERLFKVFAVTKACPGCQEPCGQCDQQEALD